MPYCALPYWAKDWAVSHIFAISDRCSHTNTFNAAWPLHLAPSPQTGPSHAKAKRKFTRKGKRKFSRSGRKHISLISTIHVLHSVRLACSLRGALSIRVVVWPVFFRILRMFCATHVSRGHLICSHWCIFVAKVMHLLSFARISVCVMSVFLLKSAHLKKKKLLS